VAPSTKYAKKLYFKEQRTGYLGTFAVQTWHPDKISQHPETATHFRLQPRFTSVWI
jgi:hypothetical protein